MKTKLLSMFMNFFGQIPEAKQTDREQGDEF